MHGQYTENALRAKDGAERHAVRRNHEYVGVEHLFWSLIDIEGCGAVKILMGFDVVPSLVGIELGERIKDGPEMVRTSNLNVVPRLQRVLYYAHDEAMQRERKRIGTTDLLLAILREGESEVARVLASRFEVTLGRVRAVVRGEGVPTTYDRPINSLHVVQEKVYLDGRDPQQALRQELMELFDRLQGDICISHILVSGRTIEKK